MSLLDTASLILTPNGYKGGVTTGKLYSVKPTDASGDMDVTRNTTATRVNSAELIAPVAINVPRLDYTGGGCPSILVEPARTNLILYSEQFNQANWIKADTTVTANATTAPDGTSTADNVVPSATTAFHSVRQSISVTPSISHTFSVYAKANGYTKVALADGATGGFAARFDLSAESVISTIIGTTATITNVGSGWYRLTATFTTTALSTPSITGYPTGATLNSFGALFTGDGTSGVFLWGGQFEAGAYATSYIPTVAATATRNADVITRNNIYTNNLITSSGGTWFMELNKNLALTRDGSMTGLFLDTSTDSFTNGFNIRNIASNSRLNISSWQSGSGLGLYTTTTDTTKIAIKWNGTTADIFENGTKVVTATSFTPTAMQFLKVNSLVGIPYNIKQMALWATPLSDPQCIDLTN